MVFCERELTRPAPLGVGTEREKLCALVHDHISELIARIVGDMPQVCFLGAHLVGNIIFVDDMLGP